MHDINRRSVESCTQTLSSKHHWYKELDTPLTLCQNFHSPWASLTAAQIAGHPPVCDTVRTHQHLGGTPGRSYTDFAIKMFKTHPWLSILVNDLRVASIKRPITTSLSHFSQVAPVLLKPVRESHQKFLPSTWRFGPSPTGGSYWLGKKDSHNGLRWYLTTRVV